MEQETTIPIEKAKDYILSGKAVVIFYNTQKNITFKYKVRQDNKNEHLWWVNTLINDPVSGKPYLIGTIENTYSTITQDRTNYEFRVSSKYIHDIQPFKDTFKAMWQRIARGYWKEGTNEGEVYKIMHDGTCGRCGRQLTDIDSLRIGLGSECRKILGISI